MGFLPGYADDFLPVSPSAEWMQKILDQFVDFCAEKGFVINPDKCKAMASSTIAHGEHGLQLPTFHIAGRKLEYVDSAKYLGFTLTSTLSTRNHMRASLSKFRKAIYAFKSTIKIKKTTLLLRFARVYVIPTIHNLEFVERLEPAHVQRFDFLLTKFFNFRSIEQLEQLRQDKPWLSIKWLHEQARKRYTEF